MTKEEIMIEDILKQSNISIEQLKDYQFLKKDNHCLFFIPCLVRFENEVYIQSWDYYINEENRILSTGINYWGEGKPLSFEESVYFKSDDQKDIDAVLYIVQNHNQYFKEEIFKKGISDILSVFNLEIIIQKQNYRVRIRSLFNNIIAYDFFYNQELKEFKLNQYNPNSI